MTVSLWQRYGLPYRRVRVATRHSLATLGRAPIKTRGSIPLLVSHAGPELAC
jgi:hypothetical protein